MAQSRAWGCEHPINDPWGGPAYGEYLKGGWVGEQLGRAGDAISGAAKSVGDAVTTSIKSIGDVASKVGSAIDRNVIQPIYREVIQPVGHVFEQIGQQIKKDPITFLAQIAAIAAAPFTAGQSLWALPVITAASTAAHGGTMSQILTATAISAATAWAGGAGGVGTGVGGLLNGIADAGMQCVPTFAGQAVSLGTQQVLTQVATGITMAGINAGAAAAQGKDALKAALPALIGTAAGAGMQALANTPQFQELGAALNKVGDNLGSIAQTTLTGITASFIKSAVVGKDVTSEMVSTLSSGLISGLTSSVDSISSMFKDGAGNYTHVGAAAQGVLSSVAAQVMSTAFIGGKAGDALSASTTAAIAKTIGTYATPVFSNIVDAATIAYNNAKNSGESYRQNSQSLEDLVATRSLYIADAEKQISIVGDAKSKLDKSIDSYQKIVDGMNNGEASVNTKRLLGSENDIIAGSPGQIVAYGANGQWSYLTIPSSGKLALNNQTFGDPIQGVVKAGYIVTLGGYEMADLHGAESNIKLDLNYYNNLNAWAENQYETVFSPHIDEIDANLAKLKIQVDESAQKFADSISIANTKAQALADKENIIVSAATKAVVLSIDPSFNAEQYVQINGLGGDVNAYGHYLALGKYQGLTTNMADASGPINNAYSGLMTDLAKRMGYNNYIEIPPDVLAETHDKLYSMFGNNLSALKNASVDSILAANKELKITDLMPKVSAEEINAAVKNYVTENPTVGSYRPAAGTFTMPDGYKYATQEDVAKAMVGKSSNVGTMIDSSGHTIYVTRVPTTTPVLIYDKTTGDMTTAPTASVLTDMVNSKTLAAGDKLKIFATASPDLLKYISDSFPAVGTDTATFTDTAIKTIRDGAKIILESASTEDSPLIYKIAAKGLDVGAMTLDGIAQVTSSATFLESMLRDVNPNDQASMEISKTLNAVSGAMRSDDMKSSIQSLNEALKTKGFDVVGAVLNNVADNPAGMINFIGTNLVSMLPGFAAGKWVGTGTTAAAELEGFAANAIQKLVGNAAVNTTRVYEIGMEAASNGLSAFNEARDLLKKQNPSWTDAQLDSEAMSRAKLVAGTAALTTIGTQVIGLDKVTQNLMGTNNPSAPAFRSILDKLVASPLAEAVGESFQSGIPQVMQELLFKEIDPSRTVETAIGNIAGQTTLGFIAGAGSAVAMGSLSTVQDLPALAVETNAAFNQAIKSGNYTMGELGTVINQWIPPSTQVSTDFVSNLRNDVTQQVLISNPQYALSYSTPQAYMDAIKNTLGIWEVPVLADIANAVPKFSGSVITTTEATKILTDKGLTGVTAADAINSGLVGAPAGFDAKATDYVNKNMISLEELKSAATQENYTATAEELNNLVGRGVQAEVIAKFVQQIDPKAVTTAEATQFFKNEGYDKATAADIAQFVKSAPESEVTKAVADWVDPRQVTRKEAVDYFVGIGYVPTEAEIAKYVVQGPAVVESDIKKQLTDYVDPRFVDANEVATIFKTMGLNAPVSASDLIRLGGQYAESDLAAKAKENINIVTANSMYSMFGGDPSAIQSIKDSILKKVDEFKSLNMTQAEANSAALNAISSQLGTTKTDLLSALGATEQNLTVQISGAKNQILDKMQEYQNQGMSSDDALKAAIDTVSLELKTTRSDLLGALGTTEAGIKTFVGEQISSMGSKLAEQIAANENAGMLRDQATQKAIDSLASQLGTTRTDILNKIDITSQQFQNAITVAKTDINNQMTLYKTQTSSEIQKVSDLLGKPVSQITANDVAMVQNMISGQTATNLAYDVNHDNKVDAADLALIQQQQQIEQKQNVEVLTDPATGLPVYTDKVTGKVITGFTPAEGTPWAPTGMYAKIADQDAKNAAIAKANAETAAKAKAQAEANQKRTQQQANLNQMMSYLAGANDIGGQQVTVKGSDPAKINYIYDWSSIFATPQQAQMMPSPYGPMNFTGQQAQQNQQKQAANQGLYSLASGFAQGGIVGEDVQVGETSMDDILNILKGNSG